MPDKQGFDHLTRFGRTVQRCIWCPYEAPPGASDGHKARHARKHTMDEALAREASQREVTTSQAAIAV